jgi:hypothetical protein
MQTTVSPSRASASHVGFAADRYAVTTASSGRPLCGTVFSMADPRHIEPALDASLEPQSDFDTRVQLTQADFDALVHELEALRRKHRSELAWRLREARAFGSSTENDDLLAVAEDAVVEQARIAQLEELVRLAPSLTAPSLTTAPAWGRPSASPTMRAQSASTCSSGAVARGQVVTR